MIHHVDRHVGQKVKQARTLKHMSQTDVANKLGLSFQQVQKYETGANRVSASRLFEIATVLDVPLNFFFDGLGETDTAETKAADLKIMRAIASIESEQVKKRIVTFIEDVSGNAFGNARTA